MALGFIGDVFEEVGEIILPRGTRGETIGGLVGLPKTGAVLSQALSSATGKSATSTPTVVQSPQYAPESAVSSTGPNVYRPGFTDYERAGVPMYASTGYPSTVTKPGAIGMAETILDVAYNVGSGLFGGYECGKKLPKLVGMTKDGCPTVTRKQQRVLRQMAQYMPLESVAYEAGVDTTTMARLISKSFPPRSKGISGSQLRTAKRVNNQILNMAHKLGYDCKPMTTARRGCK
jgi:hypothetical protein